MPVFMRFSRLGNTSVAGPYPRAWRRVGTSNSRNVARSLPVVLSTGVSSAREEIADVRDEGLRLFPRRVEAATEMPTEASTTGTRSQSRRATAHVSPLQRSLRLAVG